MIYIILFFAAIFAIIIFLLLIIFLIEFLFSPVKKMPKHSASHPGITDYTIFGQKDIICPYCNSPYCEFYYSTTESAPTYKTSVKVHPLNPFKPFVEEKTKVSKDPDIKIKQYRCTKCGKIFM